MSNSTLVLSRFSSFQHIPATATFSSVSFDGPVLLDHLRLPHLSRRLHSFCTNVDSLNVSFAGCGARMTDNALAALFEFLSSIQTLRRLEIRNFVLSNPSRRPHVPMCLNYSPLRVRNLTIAHTESTSLAFLLGCIEAHDVALESCLWIERFPDCARLELYNIQPSEELAEVLMEWDGDALVVDSCPFVSEAFVHGLLQRMTATQEALWPSARLSFGDYPYDLKRRLIEFLDVRSRL